MAYISEYTSFLSCRQVNKAAVVAVGPGRRNLTNGELIPVSVKEGDNVLLPEYGGQTIKLESQE